MKNKIILFMPSIEGGGVEKNFFLVCNYLVHKFNSLKVITDLSNLFLYFLETVITLRELNLWTK